MVRNVRILNKRIIKERHKRAATPTHNTSENDTMCIDLSHVIEDGMVTYQGLPGPSISDHLSREQSRTVYAEGTEFQIGRIEMVANTGTYLDTPFHRYRNGFDLSEIPLERVSNVPASLVRLTGLSQRAIDWISFVATDVQGRAVLIHTGWDIHWRTDCYFHDHPFLTQKAAEYLRDRGAILVGIDSVNIDDTGGKTRPVHSILLGAGIPIVEHLTNLSALPAEGFRFSAVPPRFSGMGSFPVRAHATIQKLQRSE